MKPRLPLWFWPWFLLAIGLGIAIYFMLPFHHSLAAIDAHKVLEKLKVKLTFEVPPPPPPLPPEWRSFCDEFGKARVPLAGYLAITADATAQCCIVQWSPFDKGKSLLLPIELDVLNDMLPSLKKVQGQIAVTGYESCEARGDLALRRALFVRNYLQSMGVRANQLITLAGDDQSCKSNMPDTPTGLGWYRRVDIKVCGVDPK